LSVDVIGRGTTGKIIFRACVTLRVQPETAKALEEEAGDLAAAHQGADP
jgi:hypothetical protein